MPEFKKGDVVRLKSGGPRMTVENVGDFGRPHPADGVKCVWFDGPRQERAVFDSAVLKAENDEGGFRSVPIHRA